MPIVVVVVLEVWCLCVARAFPLDIWTKLKCVEITRKQFTSIVNRLTNIYIEIAIAWFLISICPTFDTYYITIILEIEIMNEQLMSFNNAIKCRT